MGKNKRARELGQFHDLRDRAAGIPVAKRPTGDAEKEVIVDGVLQVYVDDDLDVKDIDISKLPTITGRQTKTTDISRFHTWHLKEIELKRPGARLDTIRKEEIVHVRTHAQANSAVERLLHLSSSQENAPLIVGFDSEGMCGPEGEPAIFQVSAKAGGDEITAVFQLHSGRKSDQPVCLFDEGPPTVLRRIFLLPNAIFVGQDICTDVRKTARACGVSQKEVDELMVADTTRLYHLAEALARGPEVVKTWLLGGSDWLFSDVSLKIFAQFVQPDLILDKHPDHRNHLADFAEQRGWMPVKNLSYSGLDARRARDAVIDFALLLRVPVSVLGSSIAEPDVIESPVFAAVLQRFADDGGDEGLSSIEKQILGNLDDAIPEIKGAMARSHKEATELRANKKIVLRKTKLVREKIKMEKAIEIVVVEASGKRVFVTASPSSSEESVADVPPSSRAETHPDPDVGKSTKNDDDDENNDDANARDALEIHAVEMDIDLESRNREEGVPEPAVHSPHIAEPVVEKPRPSSSGAIPKAVNRPRIEEITVSSDSGEETDDPLAFKRGPKKVTERFTQQVTEVMAVVETRTSNGFSTQEGMVIKSTFSSQNLTSFSSGPNPSPSLPVPLMSIVTQQQQSQRFVQQQQPQQPQQRFVQKQRKQQQQRG